MAIDMTNAIASRNSPNVVAPTKISFNDLVVKACAMALRKHPQLIHSWTGEAIRQNNQIHISVAVAVAEELLVPVIKHTDIKNYPKSITEVQYLANRAKEKNSTGRKCKAIPASRYPISACLALINLPRLSILRTPAY